MQKKINYIKGVFLVLVISLTSLSNMHSQVPNRTKMQDASISSPNSVPHTGAVLELESNNRGMLVPRMTTAQRDAMPLENRSESLFIYNITTGCFNYWSESQETWLSLCGTPPPAVFHISSTQCLALVKNGVYKQGDALNNSNYLSVHVTVTQPGMYDVMATTLNGYYFTTSGTFPNVGNYTIQLQGTGTPSNGYNSGDLGDLITINLNGIESDCKPHVFVEKANVSYSLDCNAINNTGVIGDYYIGIATNTANKLVVPVNVSSIGYWSMSTATVNGVYFSGTGTFTSTGNQTVELLASGTPINSGSYNYNITTNSDSGSNCNNISVDVETLQFTIDCNNAIINGSYMQGVATSSTNTITLPINVTATGQTTITTTSDNGLTFSSGLITLSALGAQNVILKASGTPINGINTILNIENPSISNTSCSVDIPVAPQPVTYTMTCNSIVVNGSYAPGVALTNANTMTIQVNATYGGTWNITSDTQNGVSFSGSGTLTVGNNTLTLLASGTPIDGGNYTFTLTSNSAAGTITCTKSVLFIYRTMKILGLGGGAYQPGTASATTEAARMIPLSTANFSATGIFPAQFTIVDGGYYQDIFLKNLINNNDIDIIFIGYNYNATSGSVDILDEFVKVKKGVVLHSQETGILTSENLINTITGGNVDVSGLGTTLLNPALNIDDPLLNGPFYDIRGLYLGNDVNNAYYASNLPTNVTSLAHQNNNSAKSWMFKHNTLGYVWIGDSGWVAGTHTGGYATSDTTWPAKVTSTGVLQPKTTYTGGTVYNSYLYANVLAWAAKYVEENTVTTYKIQ